MLQFPGKVTNPIGLSLAPGVGGLSMRDADHFFLCLSSPPAMSAATDKARFYLEQSVPELKEYERKKLFSKVCDAGKLRRMSSANVD